MVDGRVRWFVRCGGTGTPVIDSVGTVNLPRKTSLVCYLPLPDDSTYASPLVGWENNDSFGYINQLNAPARWMVIVGTNDGIMAAYSVFDGARLWSFRDAYEPNQSAVTTRRAIYFATEGGDLIALDYDGNLMWRESLTELPVRGPALDAGGNLFVTVSNGNLVKVGAE